LWRRRVWQPACAKAKADATPYDGRHSFASLFIHEGRSIAYVAAALGHSSATTTLNHYAHLFDDWRLGTGVDMIAAITTARTKLERSGVRPVCATNPPRVLRNPRRMTHNRLAMRVPASGAYRDRTGDPQLAKLVLSQLS
jgi:hypothetical protein